MHSNKHSNIEIDGNRDKWLNVSGIAISSRIDGSEQDSKGLEVGKWLELGKITEN